jgi:hypothetical protein
VFGLFYAAAKLPFVKKLAEEALQNGKCVVIGLVRER